MIKIDQLSRIEEILESKISGRPYKQRPQSRIEELLIQLPIGDGSGGSIDLTEIYDRLYNLEYVFEEISEKITRLEMHAILDNSFE